MRQKPTPDFTPELRADVERTLADGATIIGTPSLRALTAPHLEIVAAYTVAGPERTTAALAILRGRIGNWRTLSIGGYRGLEALASVVDLALEEADRLHAEERSRRRRVHRSPRSAPPGDNGRPLAPERLERVTKATAPSTVTEGELVPGDAPSVRWTRMPDRDEDRRGGRRD